MTQVAAIILAAGKGTRIHATPDKNKVVYEINQRPIIAYTVEHLKVAGITSIVAVVGFAAASVKKILGEQVRYARQSKRLGTGHALKLGLSQVPAATKTILSMYGDDSAFYPPALFKAVIASHLQSTAPVTVVTVTVPDPTGLGRIIRDQAGHLVAIVEEKNATTEQKLIREINTGLFCFNHDFLSLNLPRLTKNPVSGEYYLTDIIALCVDQHFPLNVLPWPDNSIWHGVNTQAELQAVNHLKITS